MENSNDTIGNRTRDFPACSAVPQPNALPAACHIGISYCGNLEVKHSSMRGFRLLSRCKLDLCPFEMLRSVDW
jgi:hypothetical protein